MVRVHPCAIDFFNHFCLIERMNFRVEVKKHEFQWIFFIEADNPTEARLKAEAHAMEDEIDLSFYRVEIYDA